MWKTFFLVVLVLISFSQVTLEAQVVIYQGANIHIGNGKIVNNGVLAIENDKITFVGSQSDFKNPLSNPSIINVKGKEIYPSLISLYTNVGLTELEAVRASRDDFEIGDLNSHIHTHISYNVDNDVIPTLRSNGILLAQITPRGGLIAGNSSAMTLFGNSWEEALYKANEGIHLNFPSLYNNSSDKDAYFSEIDKIRNLFEAAKLYNGKTFKSEKNLRLENLGGLFDGSKTLYINTSFSKDIICSVNLAKEIGILKIVVVGAENCMEALDFLKTNQIPVVLKRLFTLPNHADCDLQESYQFPKILKEKGILFALSYFGSDEAAYSRSLSFNAGSIVSFGLSKEEALESITLSAAKVLGIDKQTGSLEVGKEANFLILDGDLLDYKSSKIEEAYFRGKKLNLENKQKNIYQSYLQKYNLKE